MWRDPKTAFGSRCPSAWDAAPRRRGATTPRVKAALGLVATLGNWSVFSRLKDLAAGDPRGRRRHGVGGRAKVLGIDGAGVNKSRIQLALSEQMCPVCC